MVIVGFHLEGMWLKGKQLIIWLSEWRGEEQAGFGNIEACYANCSYAMASKQRGKKKKKSDMSVLILVKEQKRGNFLHLQNAAPRKAVRHKSKN